LGPSFQHTCEYEGFRNLRNMFLLHSLGQYRVGVDMNSFQLVCEGPRDTAVSCGFTITITPNLTLTCSGAGTYFSRVHSRTTAVWLQRRRRPTPRPCGDGFLGSWVYVFCPPGFGYMRYSCNLGIRITGSNNWEALYCGGMATEYGLSQGAWCFCASNYSNDIL
jgi:hypothetical protein